MKQIKRMVVYVLVVLVAFLYAHIAKTNAVYDRQSDSSTYGITGNTQMAVEQEFVCVEKAMDAIQVKCQVQQTENAYVNLTLMDIASGNVVASCRKELAEIESGKWNTFSFETVENCKGKMYQVILEGEGMTYFAEQSTEPETRLCVNGTEQEGTLLIKTVTRKFDVETFGVFLMLVLYAFWFFHFLNRLFSR